MMEKRTNIFNILLGLALLSLLSACVQSMQLASRTLEQSRQTPPSWLKADMEANGPDLVYVKTKDRVFDLPLGLTQAQDSAVLNLQFIVRNQILAKVLSQHSLTPQDKQQLDKELQKILEGEISAQDVQDIYFERLMISGDPNALFPDYYRIYVLTKLAKTRIVKIVGDLRKNLEGSGSANLAAAVGSVQVSANN